MSAATNGPSSRREDATTRRDEVVVQQTSRRGADEVMVQAAPTLGSGNLRDVVRLPEGEDLNEWLAVNIMDVFNQVRMVYGTIAEFCTPVSCPLMTAGSRYQYSFSTTDGGNSRVLPTPATVYIDYVMTWVQDQLDDENVFPSQIGNSFPRDFVTVCESIMRRLLRVYGHIYHSHAAKIREQRSTPHLNTSFKQFILFALQFKLVPQSDLEPLRQIIEGLIGA